MRKETSPSDQRAQLDFRNRVNITSETFVAIMKHLSELLLIDDLAFIIYRTPMHNVSSF